MTNERSHGKYDIIQGSIFGVALKKKKSEENYTVIYLFFFITKTIVTASFQAVCHYLESGMEECVFKRVY